MAKDFTALPLFVFFLGSECIEFISPAKKTMKLTSVSPTSLFNSKHETGSLVSLLNQNGFYLFACLALMGLWIIYRIAAPKRAVKTPGLQMGGGKQPFPGVYEKVNRIREDTDRGTSGQKVIADYV